MHHRLLRRTRSIAAAWPLIACLTLAACADEPVALPDALLGEWRSSDERYTDRFIALEAPALLRIGLGDEGEQVLRIEKFTELDKVSGERRFVLACADSEGERSELDLLLKPRHGALYVGGNRSVAWRLAEEPR